MRVVLTDGSEFSCENFKAIDSGVLLTKDKKRKKVVGFVPHHQLRYVVGDDLELVERSGDESHSTTGGKGATSQIPPDDADAETLVVEPSTTAAVPDVEEDGESMDEDRESTGEVGASEKSELRRLGGLGSTYAERLRTAGYETLEDLARADPVAVAEAASVAPGRGRRWVDAAGRAAVAGVSEDAVESADASGTGDAIETDERLDDDGEEADSDADEDDGDSDETSDSDEAGEGTEEAAQTDDEDGDEESDRTEE